MVEYGFDRATFGMRATGAPLSVNQPKSDDRRSVWERSAGSNGVSNRGFVLVEYGFDRATFGMRATGAPLLVNQPKSED